MMVNALTAPKLKQWDSHPKAYVNKLSFTVLFTVSFPMSYEPLARKEALISSEIH